MEQRNNSENSIDSLEGELNNNYEKVFRVYEKTTNGDDDHLHYEIKRLEFEKCKLQAALEESEVALEQEENKNLRVQRQLSQVRKETEEEFRADINGLQIALDQAKKQSNTYKNIKRHQQELLDLQNALQDEQRERDNARDQLELSECRVNGLQIKYEESRTLLEQTERGRKQVEQELCDAHRELIEKTQENFLIFTEKNELENQVQKLKCELGELMNEKSSCKNESNQFAEKLRIEQGHVVTQEKLCAALEIQVGALQIKLSDADAIANQNSQKIEHYEATIIQLEKAFNDEKEDNIKYVNENKLYKEKVGELETTRDELTTRLKLSHNRVIELKTELQELRAFPEIRDEIYGVYESKYKKAQEKISMTDINENTDDLQSGIENFQAQLKLSACRVTELEKELHKARLLLDKSNRHSIKIVKELNDANEQLNSCPKRFYLCC